MKNIIDFNKYKRNRELNNNDKKKKIIIIVSVIIIIISIVLTILYYNNLKFRSFFDIYILGKNIYQEDLISIPLEYDSNVSVIAFQKNICVLAENTLKKYTDSGKLESEINIQVSNPIYSIDSEYMVISDSGGSKLYLIKDSSIVWENSVDGNIARLDVNKNGYVSVIITGTTYKSVIVVFDNKGTELFKVYLSTVTALDATISNDNTNLVFAEINTQGTSIESKVKIISIETAQETPAESVIYTYSANSGDLITNIEYNSSNNVLCMFDNQIIMIKDFETTTLVSLDDANLKMNSANITLDNHIYRAMEVTSGLFKADTVTQIYNTSTAKVVEYTVSGVAKRIYSNNSIIAINLGQEIDFIDTKGLLIKRYISYSDIQDITIGNSLAGIVYKDRVDIINL